MGSKLSLERCGVMGGLSGWASCKETSLSGQHGNPRYVEIRDRPLGTD